MAKDELPRADADSRARTHLANERTFLAWLRTGLSLIALGLVGAQYLERNRLPGVPVITGFGALLVLSGVVMTAAAGLHYVRSRDRIEAGTYEPNARVVVVAVALVAVAGLIALGIVLLLTEGG